MSFYISSISVGERIAQQLGFNLQPNPLEEVLCVVAAIPISPKLRKEPGRMSTVDALGMALIPDLAETVENYGKRMNLPSCSEQARRVKLARNTFYASVPVMVIGTGGLVLSQVKGGDVESAYKVMTTLGVIFSIWSGKKLYEATSVLRETVDSMEHS